MLLSLGEYPGAMRKPGKGVVAGSLELITMYNVWTEDSSQMALGLNMRALESLRRCLPALRSLRLPMTLER